MSQSSSRHLNSPPKTPSIRLRVALSILVCVLVFSGCAKLKKHVVPSKAKNVVLIVIDTLRSDHLGCYGYERNTTPNIDRLAEKSALFERSYSHCSWTMPSIASMFTSLHPRDHGVAEWCNPLDRKYLTLVEHLKANGYHTEAFVGHTVLKKRFGFDQGFDHYDSSILKKSHPHQTISSEYITDRAIKALDTRVTQPFFMWLHYFDPHRDYYSHEGFEFGETEIDKYDSEIAFTDHHIGRFLDHLKSLGLYKNTIIMIVADHGEEFGEHGGKYHGPTLFEEVVHVPLIVKVPRFSRQRIKNVVIGMDLAPTLLKLLGMDVPAEFKGKAIPTARRRFVPKGDRTVVLETFHSNVAKRAIIRDGWKLIQDLIKDNWKLYDLKNDPKEKRDLVKDRPQKTEAIRTELTEFYKNPPTEAVKNKLSEEQIENLKGLGYL
jgi:arylsulfatase A-like enzyme